MASQEQIIPISQVADTLGVQPQKVIALAGKRTSEWWTGEPAVTLDVARKISETVNTERAEQDREYLNRLADEEQAVKDQFAEAQARADARNSQPRVLHGVETSFPGDPGPAWAKESEE